MKKQDLNTEWNEVDLAVWRKKHGLTQDVAARVLDMTRIPYNRMEAGESKISRRTVLSCLFFDERPDVLEFFKLEALNLKK